MLPPMPRLILASASPRRRQLLEEAGFAFDIEPSGLDEEAISERVDPAHLPQVLAEAKAQEIAARHPGEPVVVLAGDTVVYSSQGKILGKPADAADAGHMLQTLAGTLHRVVTGICAIRCDDGRRRVERARSDVLMRPLSEAEVTAYVASGAWEGKAGGYGVQDTPGRDIGDGDPFIESIGGELTNIVGLPMPQVIDILSDLGIDARR